MRVLLIQPDSSTELIGWGDLGAIAEPLALEYLAASACMDGHQVELLDLRLHRGTLARKLRSYQPNVVAVTGYSMHVLRNLAICQEVKSLLPGCWTFVGGHHATLLPEDFFTPTVDFVVVGEGTSSFRTVLRLLERGETVTSVHGVWFRSADGKFHNDGKSLPFRVDEIVPPKRDLVLNDRPYYFIDWMRPIALLRNTVGCPYRCSFCSLWRIMDGVYYKRDLTQVVTELAAIEEECVFLVDDEAFVDSKRMGHLARAIESAGLKKKLFTYCRIDTLLRERELLEAWRRIGLERLFIGIESITDEELQHYNKRLKVVQIEEGLRIARELGIKVFAGFIVNPDFTERDFKRLIRFIEHNKVDYPSFTVWTPLPGTEALQTFDHVIERQANGRPNWTLFDLQHPVVQTRLPREKFIREYHNLHKIFSAQFAQYRDVGRIVASRNGVHVS